MRHSQSAYELFDKEKILMQSKTGNRKTPSYLHRLAVDSVITSKGSLVLLNGTNAIEVHKPRKLSQLVNRAQLNDVYLPAVTEKTSNLQAARVNLSLSLPYVYGSRHHRSTSSIISQRASDFSAKMNYLKEQKEARKSNVLVTMLYLGQGKSGTSQDDMKVLQQKCGGENICVFKGSVQPGDELESCCSSPLFIPAGMEKSVPRTRMFSKDAGKVLTDSDDMNDSRTNRKRQKRQRRRYSLQRESKRSEASQDKRDTKEDETKSTVWNSPIPPLEKLRNIKEHDKQQPKTNNKDRVLDELWADVPFQDLSQDKIILSEQIGKKMQHPRESNGKSRNEDRLRDFYEECVEMSTGVESSLEQHKWFKANKFERNKIREQLSLGHQSKDSASDLELSEESDNNAVYLKSLEPRTDIKSQEIPENNADKQKQELQKKLDAIMEVLNTSDEVELVLRNTGVTDELLMGFVAALKSSLSEITLVNLNLNHIGPPGVYVLLDLLQAKLEIRGLLLFGNHLGDVGVQILLNGVAELQEKTAASPRKPMDPKQFYFPYSSFTLTELDLGGNGIGSEGLRVLGTFIRYHSQLQYLGLAQTCCSSMEAWYDFFESIKVNNKLTHIILDENNLRDQGIKLFAEALQINEGLQKIDLDHNSFGEVGGNALFEALSRSQCSLIHLSLEDNYISTALMSKFQQLVKTSDEHTH
ncbi:NLR family CARD domain-containing protein 3 [Bagarius yarrelli]|uniref:NLR family CARD domain-containing protein 3 n=1 Tax=Bagarius yarrelli TaxID=175774 RepID=A0A556U5E4_BAGYA|nr:NLR family CARD domain-containing protein 3 [Bagarius yarrelli]